ncbi:ABC transporter ATP-binding protein [Paenibacillus enshidis]|uniref:ABC transporter ATP-binding protein n=1 Tax=Paenibacillus enshidis TaxID=1458439 RepID=A0ABV5AVN8_9BACL
MQQQASNAKISCKNLNKIYRSKKSETFALKDINMDIADNEFISVVGPSGCGKSTLLRIFAGLDEATTGDVMVDNRIMTGPGADRGMVFQAYTLFPWLTVENNIRFGLKVKKMSKAEADQIVEKYLKLVGLTDFRHRLPKELSGGMKQRVAIARALANSPEVLLMDEPFGALDPDTKGNMQLQLRELWEKEKHTVIFITHDIEEAVFLSQRVYVMSARPGRIIADIAIDLPTRRDLDLKDTHEFIQIRKKIHSLLHSGDFRNELHAAT